MKLLGSLITEKFSGKEFECVAIRHLVTGCKHIICRRYGVNSSDEPYGAETIDLHDVEGYETYELPLPDANSLLGKKVVDTLCEYKGTCIAVIEYAKTTTRVLIQGTGIVANVGLPPEPHVTDLEYVKLQVTPRKTAEHNIEEPKRKTGASVIMSGRVRGRV